MAHQLQPRLVLLDSGLPGSSGADVCRALRADIATAAAGIIFVTGRQEVVDVIAGFDAGADDYVAKPFRPGELLARVQALLRRSQELRGLSPLTGLPGDFVIERELRRLMETKQPFALLYVDLDNFKAFNDRYGFLRGDDAIVFTAAVLRSVAQSIRREPRFVGHVGAMTSSFWCRTR